MKLALILLGVIAVLGWLGGGWRQAIRWLFIIAAMVFILFGPFVLSGLAHE